MIPPNPGSDEIWKPVLGYEGRYEISSSGNVASLNWEGNTGRRKLLCKSIRKGRGNAVGYYVVRLHKDKSVRPVTCGRLVLEAFCPTIGQYEVNHKNGVSLDDRVENLEWVTRSENQKHAVANGLASYPISPNNILDAGKKYYWVHTSGEARWATPSSMAREFSLDTAYLFKMVNRAPHHHSFKGWEIKTKPTPGSAAAIAVSCVCPVLDNRFGVGLDWGPDGVFVISEDCPLHKEDFIKIEEKSKIVEVKPPKRKGSGLELAWAKVKLDRPAARDFAYAIVNQFPHSLNKPCCRCEMMKILDYITKEK